MRPTLLGMRDMGARAAQASPRCALQRVSAELPARQGKRDLDDLSETRSASRLIRKPLLNSATGGRKGDRYQRAA